ncbi:MAG: Fic family protein [Crenarchaeota archaeon]|nr:Fic family protein [Thermoproteota archaeon]
MKDFKLTPLPPKTRLETTRVLKQLASSHRALAELNGYANIIPNKNILINAVTINEAKDSSEIENIITTHDELYKAMAQKTYTNSSGKEVLNYRSALWYGFEFVNNKEMLTINAIVDIQKKIENNDAGIRSQPGTKLINDVTGEIVYTPPETKDEILDLLKNLEQYINIDNDSIDHLIKLAVIHYQFEAIHPFYDGNGRTGRIVNILYLTLKGLLDSPILYLSKYIIRNKSSYYRLIKEVSTSDNWEEWILFILSGIEETAEETLLMVKNIYNEFNQYADDLKNVLPKIYSKELVELLFFEFYSKITYIEEGLGVSRKTASTYLNELEEKGFLRSERIGKERIFVNQRLMNVVKEAAERK